MNIEQEIQHSIDLMKQEIEKETADPKEPESTHKQRLWTFNYVMQRLIKRQDEYRNSHKA